MSHAKREVGAACAWRLFFHAEAVTIAFFVQPRALHLQSRLASAILLITDVFHPIDDFAVERFLNGNVRHRRRRRRTVLMFFFRLKPDHIAWPDFLYRAAPALNPPKAGHDDQRLTKWMCMPGGAGTRLERDARATNTCRFGGLEQRVNTNCAGKILRRTFAGILGTRSFYLHGLNVVVSDSPSTLTYQQLNSLSDSLFLISIFLVSFSQLRKGAWLPRSFTLSTTNHQLP